jgi:hypothetical protein
LEITLTIAVDEVALTEALVSGGFLDPAMLMTAIGSRRRSSGCCWR